MINNIVIHAQTWIKKSNNCGNFFNNYNWFSNFIIIQNRTRAVSLGVIFVNLIPLPIFIMIPLAVGFGVFVMIIAGVTHPPAGGNPIIVIIGSASFSYIISPIIIGTAIILVFGVVLNRFILKKEYPKR